ncbi:RNA polymerase sigma factor [Pyxidicoccus xibeiensis]|uniref:RNA polymerase sigma factor n=1 Tax=Pyxidicoccus xibeiensis TaxID=2906759 RepID=UPI0020A71974|nr:RNA polymerase sigma factor [Pyxidicoccus xibeiensis]MCP3138996.1 RNA polymerase sigma factor [Pyxidicoccus xibeiensis]
MDKGNDGHWASAYATRNRTWLVARAQHLCRNASDAEDLVQEALFRFIREFSGEGARLDESRCGAWLMKTISTLFYDQLRRQRVRDQNAKDPTLRNEVVDPLEPTVPSVYDTVTDERFSQAVQSLSPKLRATFELYAAGHRYQDIARILDIHIGAVAKRLFDARARLREFFNSGDK